MNDTRENSERNRSLN